MGPGSLGYISRGPAVLPLNRTTIDNSSFLSFKLLIYKMGLIPLLPQDFSGNEMK